MSERAIRPVPKVTPRIQYLGETTGPVFREFRLAVHTGDTACEFGFRIALSAFTGGLLRMQDGPDLCYQTLARDVADGGEITASVREVSAAELEAYHAAHLPPPRRTRGPVIAAAAAEPAEPAVR